MNLDYKLTSLTEIKSKCLAGLSDGNYFLTITLDPKIYRRSINEQYITVKDFIKNLLKQWCSVFWLVPELTNQSNIHFHGYIKLSFDHYRHHIIDVLKRFPLGMSKINDQKISDKERVVNYMYKDYHTTVKFIHNPRIKYFGKIPKVLHHGGPTAPAEGRPHHDLDPDLEPDLYTAFVNLDIAEYNNLI